MYPIQYLKLTNIGRHELLELDTANTQVVRIQGGGETGKTTILDAIIMALTGGRNLDTYIKQGEEEATIDTVISGLTIHVTLRPGKSRVLELRDGNGLKIKDAAKYLDAIYGTAALRPIDIYRSQAKDRSKMILRSTSLNLERVNQRLVEITGHKSWTCSGLDEVFPFIEQATQNFYDERTVANRDRDTAKKSIETLQQQLPSNFDPEAPVPNPPPSVANLYQRRREVEAFCGRFVALDTERKGLLEQIAALQSKLQGVVVQLEEMQPNVDTAFDEIKQIDQQIAVQEQQQQQYTEYVTTIGEMRRLHGEVEAAKQRHVAFAAEADRLDAIVKKLQALPGQLLEEAQLPVAGMELRGDDVYIDGVALDRRGDSKKLMACIQIAMKLAPLPFVLIDRYETLDPDQREEMLHYIESEGYQAFVTEVTRGPLSIGYSKADPLVSTEEW